MRDKSSPPPMEPGNYRHFKGEVYEVTDVRPNRTNGAEDKWIVNYQKVLADGAIELSSRDAEEFLEPVFREDVSQPRFEKIDE